MRRSGHPALAVIACAVLLCAGCDRRAAPPADDAPLVKVRLALNWFPEAEHGGYFAALVHGYYREAGLDVEIVRGGPEAPVVQQVATGEMEFGVSNADGVLFGRARQAPVVAVMAPLQISPRCLLVHEKSGIREFSQLRDLTIAMSNTQAFSFYLRKKVPLDQQNVRIVPYPGNVAQFLEDDNYAQQGYVFSEPYVAKKQGGDPHVLLLSDLGFNPYTSALIAGEELIAARPELVRKMVAASLRGWQRYLDDPAAANAEIHRRNPEMSLDILAFGAGALEPLVLDQAGRRVPLGTMTLERWQTLLAQLVECEQLPAGRVDAAGAFTTEFLAPRE